MADYPPKPISAVYASGEQIVPRDDVVQNQATLMKREIREHVSAINAKLHAAKTLPVQIGPHEVGKDVRVKNAVLDMIKKAGWTCRAVPVADADSADTLYYVIE